VLGEELLKWLLANRPNFLIKNNSEVSELYYDNKGVVTGLKILGKRSDPISCDAVVICTGASTARNLS
jgi:aspartate oxidase